MTYTPDTVTFHVIHPDAPTERVTAPRSELLTALQSAVGGYIEVVYTDHGQTLLVNEEGLYLPNPKHNDLASQKASHVLDRRVSLVGPAVVIASADFD